VAGFTNTDFEAIEAAVLNTARGRWFLAEHARRNRAADTHTLLDAIRRLETGLGVKARSSITPETVAEIDEVAKSLAVAKVELTQVASEIAGEVSSRRVLDALVRLANAEERLETFVSRHVSRIAVTNTGEPALTPENLSYFKEDEELFAAPKSAGDRTELAVAVTPMVATQTQARRVVVARALPLESTASTAGERAAHMTRSGEMPTARSPEPSQGRPRILVVRSRPSEETRIPLEEEPGAIAH